MKKLLLVTVLACGLGWPATLSAQITAAVGGTVADATGALIPGVDVTALNINTGITTTGITNETGTYRIPSLQPGSYTLSAELPGFQTAAYQGVQLSAGQDVRYNFTLQVGAATQTVEVVSAADALLRTTSASVGDVLPEEQVMSLPTFSRNVLDLAALVPGSVGDNYGGMRMSQVNTTRDGLPTGDGRYLDWNGVYAATFTSPDLVEEVQVNVTTADASMGRGAGQVRMQTRSGTNEYHGALFYQNNNSALSSLNWFQNLVGAEKPYENRNQFGGRIGGPIVSNKAFFFVLVDEQRFVEKTEVVTTVLTDQARAGNFRFLTANASSGQPGATSRRNGNAFSTTPSVDLNGNILTTASNGAPLFVNSFSVFSNVNDPNRTAFDSWIATEYLPRMPQVNDWTVGDGLNTAGHRWLRTQRGTDGATGNTQTTNRDHLTVRIDYQINDDNKVSYTMTREDNWGVTGQTGLPDWPGGYFGEVARQPDVYTAAWTSTISPTVVNEFRWGLKRDTWFGEPPTDVGCCRDRRNYVFENRTELANEAASTFPEIGGHVFHITPDYGQYAWMGVPTPRGSVSPLSQFADTVNWTQGTHSLSAGFELTMSATDQFNHGGSTWTRPQVTLGVAGVAPVPGINSTNFPGLSSFDAPTAELLLANLAGSIDSLRQEYFINEVGQSQYSDYRDGVLFWREFHQNDWGAFIKDTWNMTSNLTLTLGLRYDVYGTPYEGSGLAFAPSGGQAGLFGISGTGFDAMYNPNASGGSLTVFDYAGKNSPNSDTLIYGNDYNNIAPSIGFSWNVPWLSRPTVVRGGYGISYTGAPTFLQYSSSIGSAPGSTLDLNTPVTAYTSIAGVVANPGAFFPLDTGGTQPLQAVPLTNRTLGIQGYADDKVIPYVQSFNLSVQRELADNLTFEVGYVGTKGTKLRSAQQLNIVNIFENGILDAFNTTRAGGNAPLFDALLQGIDLDGSQTAVGTVGVTINPATGNPWTGSEALRRFGTTDNWIADGEVADLASYLDSTSAGTGQNGGLLRTHGFNENFIVVNPQFGSVTLHGNNDNSIYHSLQTQITQRMSNGFTGQFSYVWSKNLGNSAAGNGNASDTTSTSRNPRNLALQRGLVGFHRTHNFKAHGTWELPFGPGRSLLATAPNWVARMVEGWEISGIFNWTSGAPLSFSSPLDTLNSQNDTNTPDLVGSLPKGAVTIGNGVVDYFPGLSTQLAPLPNFGADPNNLAADFANRVVVDGSGNIVMQNPAPGTTGNMALNQGRVEGPASLGLDMALSKRVQIGETTSFTIRADSINVLNTPQWGNPNTNINSSTFGRITSAGGTRSVTINARIDF